jgi:5-carboxymethyl-2-hydroxymuconic-semialdehyde dehydrogenase
VLRIAPIAIQGKQEATLISTHPIYWVVHLAFIGNLGKSTGPELEMYCHSLSPSSAIGRYSLLLRRGFQKLQGFAVSKLQENIAKADRYLARFRENGVLNRIDGHDVAAIDGSTFENISPVDLKPLAKVAHGKAADADRAAKAAQAAFPEWAAMPGEARKQLLHKVADAIVGRAEEIAFVECMDTGQSLKFMAKAALRGGENFRFFADRATEVRDGKALRTEGQVNVTTGVPIGPVGVITPWNTPFMLSTWKIAPALAAGCTVVHKPAEFSPLTARLLVEIAEEAGLPKGVWNLVNGFGEDAGKALTEHPLVKAIGFVGESRTGSIIMKQGADTLKRVHFELGGKNPVVVFADADLERAADAAVFMIYSMNGERCTSSSRLLVEESIYDNFTKLVAEKASRIKVGHPLDPETVVGPLIHPVHQKKVLKYIETGRSEGAKVATGGAKVDGPGGGCYVLADALYRCPQQDANRPGRNLRACVDRDRVQE